MAAREVWRVRRPGSLDSLTRETEALDAPPPGHARVAVGAIGLNFADIAACLGLYSDLPPLRDRVGDIPALVGMFIRQFNQRTGQGIPGITPRAIDALKAHPWPGNIRELRHTIERAVLFCDDELIDLGHLPPEFQALA